MANKRDYVIVGSQAIKHHFPDFPRIPNDTDVVIKKSLYAHVVKNRSDIESIQVGDHGLSSIVKFKDIEKPVEYLFADDVTSLNFILNALCDQSEHLSATVLYSLKKGHINFPIKFHKHIQDFMFLREKLRNMFDISLEQDLNSSVDLLDQHPFLTLTHFKETEKRLGKLKTPKMKGEDVKKFFGKSKKYVTSYYVHDDMHKAVALMHKGSPVYENILKDHNEVETDQFKWNLLTLEEKIWCVLEEVYVIALERRIIPPMFELKHYNTIIGDDKLKEDYKILSPKEAFDWALYRVCTTLCDGFFRDFAVKAYDEIQKQYNPDYVKLFFKNIGQYDRNYEKTRIEEGTEANHYTFY